MTCIFVTLMTMGLGTLRNEQMGNASGIFNLMRNLGGSVGIAMTNTFVYRGIQSHYSTFIPHVTIYDPVYQQQTQMLQRGLTSLTGAHQAVRQTQGIFFIGRKHGGRVLRLLATFSSESSGQIRESKRTFEKYGLRCLLIAKFIPGIDRTRHRWQEYREAVCLYFSLTIPQDQLFGQQPMLVSGCYSASNSTASLSK